jgi:hypothetical protein
MLEHKPFPLVTVHDEFKAHANNINQVRWHYKEILAEIADSNVLDCWVNPTSSESQISQAPVRALGESLPEQAHCWVCSFFIDNHRPVSPNQKQQHDHGTNQHGCVQPARQWPATPLLTLTIPAFRPSTPAPR